MKKLLALFTIAIYFVTSSTLVHSFCAKAHIEDTHAEHSCCDDEDTGSKDCFDTCMGSFSDTVSPVYEFTKKSSSDIDIGTQYHLSENSFFLQTQKYFLTKLIHDPPRQWNYVGVVKMLE